MWGAELSEPQTLPCASSTPQREAVQTLDGHAGERQWEAACGGKDWQLCR